MQSRFRKVGSVLFSLLQICIVIAVVCFDIFICGMSWYVYRSRIEPHEPNQNACRMLVSSKVYVEEYPCAKCLEVVRLSDCASRA